MNQQRSQKFFEEGIFGIFSIEKGIQGRSQEGLGTPSSKVVNRSTSMAQNF